MIRDSSQRPHERLKAGRDAMSLVESIDRITARFPAEERFGLTLQPRRCAVSVPPNIAEDAARRSRLEHLRYQSTARGSLAELDTQIQIAQRLAFIEPESELDEPVDRTFARLNALIRSLDSPARPVREDAALYESPISNPQSHAR